MMINEQREITSPAGLREATAPHNHPHSLPILPAEPLVKIRSGTSRASFDLKEVWAQRELLYLLVWRDLKVRYKQTILGAGWVILQPLLTALVFTIFMSKLARVSSGDVPYPLFAYAGLLPWLFFSNAVQSSSYSLIMNSYIITKVYFPRMIIPAAAIGLRLVDFLVASLMIFVLMFYYGIRLHLSLLLLPLLVLQLTLFTLGFGLWSSALNARYRDFGSLLTVWLQLWMFASPVIYPSSLVPEKWRLLYACNPLAGMIEGIRASVCGSQINWTSIAISVTITLVWLVYGVRVFHRTEEHIVDVL